MSDLFFKPKKTKMTAAEVIQCLKARFESPEWALAFELALVPGFANRRADAVAMNCFLAGKWGCSVLGFEIKVSRADFLHEMKQPKKRVETYAGVDALFLVVPQGLVGDHEVPADMGLITCQDGSAKIVRMPYPCTLPGRAMESKHPEYNHMVREPAKLPPLSRGLAIAMLRAFEPGRVAEVTAARQFKVESTSRERRLSSWWREAFHVSSMP